MAWRWVGLEDDQRNRAAIENNALRIHGYVNINDHVAVYDVDHPDLLGTYYYALHDVPGVTAANRFITLNNPIESSKVVRGVHVLAVTYRTGSTTSPNSMIATRASNISGGTLIPSADIPSSSTLCEVCTSEVRINNPSATLAAVPNRVFAPPMGTGAGGATYAAPTPVFFGADVELQPGEGFAVATHAGDPDQRWNITLIWKEFANGDIENM